MDEFCGFPGKNTKNEYQKKQKQKEEKFYASNWEGSISTSPRYFHTWTLSNFQATQNQNGIWSSSRERERERKRVNLKNIHISLIYLTKST